MADFEQYRRAQWIRAMSTLICAACGMQIFHGGGAAHIIANTARNNSRYSRWIVAHAENLRPAHNGSCNDRVMGIIRGEVGRDALACRIAREILADETLTLPSADRATIEKWAEKQ